MSAVDKMAEGLAKFYSSQADLILAQYENINQLLGPTTDWTHPGTHCEILLRDYLRRHLFAGMSVDKGFVYGRVTREDKEYHGPEIDILIHDTISYRPVFRLEDFVIVQPEAVLGMIQVKRTFHASGHMQTLSRGVQQLVAARQHLLDVVVQKRVLRETEHFGGDAAQVKQYPTLNEWRRVFSAVVAFEDETKGDIDTFKEILLEAYQESTKLRHPDDLHDSAVYVLPHFVGSIKLGGKAFYTHTDNISNRDYNYINSVVGEINVGLQILLWLLTDKVFDSRGAFPPFAFPKGAKPDGIIKIPDRPPPTAQPAQGPAASGS